MSEKAKVEEAIDVIDGRIPGGKRFLFYGQEGVGKTTLASFSPKPIFFDIENGSSNLAVARYKFSGGVVPKTYEEVVEATRKLISAKHSFETLVIDSLDRLELLIWDYCLRRDSGKQSMLNKYGKKLESIESYGYSKGFQVAYEEFCVLLSLLEQLKDERGMNIVIIGHAAVRTFKNPEGEDYDRYWIRSEKLIAGKAREWVDVCGFCCFEEGGGKLDADQARAKGWSSGRRLLKLRRSAVYDAKSRIALPGEFELDATDPWAPLRKAMDAAKESVPEILAAIGAECSRIGDEALTKKVRAACKGVQDTATLSRFLMELMDRKQKPQEGEGESHV